MIRIRTASSCSDFSQKSTSPLRLVTLSRAVFGFRAFQARALPGGDAFYDASLRWNTSTDLDADEIHRIGVDEVARIEREMDVLLRRQGRRVGSA